MSTSDIQQARLPLSRKYRDGGGDFLAQKTKVGLSEVTKPFLAQRELPSYEQEGQTKCQSCCPARRFCPHAGHCFVIEPMAQ